MRQNKYTIVKGCAGLGNRLVTIYSAILYSKGTQRKLIIDWRDGQFDRKGLNAFDKCFVLKNVDHTGIEVLTELNGLAHNSYLFQAKPDASIYDLYHEVHSSFWESLPNKVFPNQFLLKLRRRWQQNIKGSFSNAINFGSDLSLNNSEDVIYYLDQLPFLDYKAMPDFIELSSEIAKIVENNADRMKLNQKVGVHVRFSDKKPTVMLSRLIALIKEKFPDNDVFLSTDSSLVQELFSKNFHKVLCSDKFLPELKGEGLHQWALYNQRDDLKYLLYEQSVIDMFLLSKCKYLFFQGNSTFSNVSKIYHPNIENCYDWLKQ